MAKFFDAFAGEWRELVDCGRTRWAWQQAAASAPTEEVPDGRVMPRAKDPLQEPNPWRLMKNELPREGSQVDFTFYDTAPPLGVARFAAVFREGVFWFGVDFSMRATLMKGDSCDWWRYRD